LNGGGGVDTIAGNGGDDIIDGGANADTMLGGQGFDIFIVDDPGDGVLEYAGEGLDQVQTSVSYALTAGSEVEVLYADQTTTAAINLIGNELDNFLAGNDGVNVIASGLGLDTLRGEGGGDIPVVIGRRGSSANNPDVVIDFNRAEGDLLHATTMDADDTVAGIELHLHRYRGISAQANQLVHRRHRPFIQLNTNADLAADSVIKVNGVRTVDASWFFL
jgi:Ca2+-binding RTX toxin-like protein